MLSCYHVGTLAGHYNILSSTEMEGCEGERDGVFHLALYRKNTLSFIIARNVGVSAHFLDDIFDVAYVE